VQIRISLMSKQSRLLNWYVKPTEKHCKNRKQAEFGA
jgi:hypothetical protein